MADSTVDSTANAFLQSVGSCSLLRFHSFSCPDYCDRLQEFKVPDKEWAGIEELFLKCDENHDGVISQEELVSAIVEITKAAAGNDGADAGLVVVGTAVCSYVKMLIYLRRLLLKCRPGWRGVKDAILCHRHKSRRQDQVRAPVHQGGCPFSF